MHHTVYINTHIPHKSECVYTDQDFHLHLQKKMMLRCKGKADDHECKKVTLVLNVEVCDYHHCLEKTSQCVGNLHGLEKIDSLKIERDGFIYKITIVGKVDPLKILEEMKNKLGSTVILVSVVDEEDTPINTQFRLNLACDRSVKTILNVVSKSRGFQGINIERTRNLVTVKGENVDTEMLRLTLQKKLNSAVEVNQVIVPPPNQEAKKVSATVPQPYWPLWAERGGPSHDDQEVCGIM
ncbi:unnamed protein product [Cuscuta europaea]|uniref:HMA domain-containing protein n=1 Tax=Cuscuta europaea TaxID=41803 RepID=A0A9P1A0S3_CUSEU|nr:unnamed protein product [Cuscuta europaea]